MRLSTVVAGVGVQCSVGLRAPEVAAAVGGALNRFRFEPRIRSQRSGARITCAWLETLPDAWPAAARMRALAIAAASEALGAVPAAAGVRLPVVLALPAARPGFDADAAGRLAREIIGALPAVVDARACALLVDGHAGGVRLLEAAERLLRGESGPAAPAVLVGGVESYRDAAALQFIEETGRLRTEDDPLGWIPGEGAGFLLLTTRDGAARLEATPLAALDASAAAFEPRPWYAGRATIGEGLTHALREVFAVPGAPAECYCDMNGESWRADEWGYAYLRTAAHHAEPLAMSHPADCWGDVGAASGPMLIALAAQRFGQRRARAARALVWAASDTSPLRAACLTSAL